MRSKRIDSTALPAASKTWCRLNLSAPSNFNLQAPSGPGSKGQLIWGEFGMQPVHQLHKIFDALTTFNGAPNHALLNFLSLKFENFWFLSLGFFDGRLVLLCLVFVWISFFLCVFFFWLFFSLCSALGPNLSWQKLQRLCSWLAQPATSWDLALCQALRLKPVSGAVSLYRRLLLGIHLVARHQWGDEETICLAKERYLCYKICLALKISTKWGSFPRLAAEALESQSRMHTRDSNRSTQALDVQEHVHSIGLSWPNLMPSYAITKTRLSKGPQKNGYKWIKHMPPTPSLLRNHVQSYCTKRDAAVHWHLTTEQAGIFDAFPCGNYHPQLHSTILVAIWKLKQANVSRPQCGLGRVGWSFWKTKC